MEFFGHAKVAPSSRAYTPPRVAGSVDASATTYAEHKTLQYDYTIVDESGTRKRCEYGPDFYSRQPLQSRMAYKNQAINRQDAFSTQVTQSNQIATMAQSSGSTGSGGSGGSGGSY